MYFITIAIQILHKSGQVLELLLLTIKIIFGIQAYNTDFEFYNLFHGTLINRTRQIKSNETKATAERA